MAVIGAVAVLLAVGGAYAVAGFASASSKLTNANRAIDAAVSHRTAFDDAPSAFEGQSADAGTLQKDATRFVQTWMDQSKTIAGDQAALASADSGLHQQQWLTAVRKGNIDSAASRIAHARKALDAARTIAMARLKEGAFLHSFADVFVDFDTIATDSQASNFAGARVAASQMVTDTTLAAGLSTDAQFPPELHQLLVAMQALAQDFVDYINAVAGGDKAAMTSLTAKANTDLASVESFNTFSISTKVDEYYQPYLDTYHSELARAESG
jgi:hypothetical protein